MNRGNYNNKTQAVINCNFPLISKKGSVNTLAGCIFHQLPAAYLQLAAAGWSSPVVMVLFTGTSTTVATDGRGLLNHTPTHIFQVSPGFWINDLVLLTGYCCSCLCVYCTGYISMLMTFNIQKSVFMWRVLFGLWDCELEYTCPKALLPTEGTTPRIHQVPKVPPACGSLIQRQFHGFGYPVNRQGETKIKLVLHAHKLYLYISNI